jgi:hypothetical protein
MKRVEFRLVTKMHEQLLDKDTGCTFMFKNSLLNDLKLLYLCFRRDEATLGPIIQRMNPFIDSRG